MARLPKEPPPTQDQFRERARAEFGFLQAEYDFEEEPIPLDRIPYLNPCAVWFANSHTRVVVEGINWGLNSRVAFGTPVPDRKFENYDLGDLIDIRDPGASARRKDSRRNQLEQLGDLAAALKRLGDDVLRGDHSVFPAIAARIEWRRAEFAAGRDPRT